MSVLIADAESAQMVPGSQTQPLDINLSHYNLLLTNFVILCESVYDSRSPLNMTAPWHWVRALFKTAVWHVYVFLIWKSVCFVFA